MRIATLLGAAAVTALPVFAIGPAMAQSTGSPEPTRADAVQAMTDLDRLAGTSGTVGLSWGIDPDTNTVVVSVPKNDRDAATTAFLNRTRSGHENVVVKRVPAAPQPQLAPGEAILTGGSRCSTAALATDGSADYAITAGHCTNIGTSWTTSDGQSIGDTSASMFPESDYGIIQITNPDLVRDNAGLTEVGEPPEGSAIEKAGSTTGVTSGTLVGYGRTVNYAEGTVYDMIETDACTQPGDSGGSLYMGSTAIGIVSGGTTGGCGAGFQSFFQPLQEAMDAGGLSLY